MADKNDLQIKLRVDVIDKNLIVLTQMSEKLQKVNEITMTIDRAQQRMSTDMMRGQTQVEEKLTRTTAEMQKLDGVVVLVDRHGALPSFNRGLERAHSKALELAKTMGTMAGPFILDGALRSVKGGADLEHEAARSRAAGLTEDEISENAALAAELSRRYPTVSQTSGMHALRNFRSVVGSAEEAAHIADPLMKMRYVVEAAHPGRVIEEDFDKLIKGLEIKGVTQNMEKFRDYIQGMTQALNTFGDTLKPADYYEMFKYGRQATQTLDREYMLEVGPTLAQELGGQGAGNAQASFHQGFIGGRLKASAIKQLEDFGLVGDPSKIIRHPQNHRILGAEAGFLKGSDLAAKNPYRWVQEVMLPAITAKVGDDPDKIQEVISGLASNRVASQFLAILATQQSRIEKDRHLVKNAPGLESYGTYQNDPLVAWKGMVTQFDNLLAVASSPTVAQAAGAMQSIAAGLSSLAEVAKNHPIFSGVAVGTAGVGGVVGTYGLLSNLMSGFGLKSSAAALDKAALDLMAAAAAQKGGALPGAISEAAAAGGFWATVSKGLRVAGVTAGSYLSIMALLDAFDEPAIQRMQEREKRQNRSDEDYPDHGFHHASPNMRQPWWKDLLFGRPEDRIGIGTGRYTTPSLGLLPAPRLSDMLNENKALAETGTSAAAGLRAARDGVGGLGDAAGQAAAAAGQAGSAIDALTGKVRDLAAAAASVPMPRPNPRADLGASLPDRGPGSEQR